MSWFLATHAPVGSGAVEHAADHAHEVTRAAGPIDPALLPFITAILVFGVAFFVLYRAVWPKITKGLDDRDRKIREEIEAAEAARAKANAALAEYERSLATAREEANAMIVKAKADAKAAAEETRTRIESDAAETKARAMREIESAKQAAISSLYNEASNLAVSIAGKILEREITPSDQKRIIDDSLHELARAGRS